MDRPYVLIVEDGPRDQLALKALLEKFDFNSESASSGEEACTLVKKRRYALILLDLTLPGIDGFECAKQIRLWELDQTMPTPIIAITGSPDCVADGKKRGVVLSDYLIKPFDPEALRKLLLRHAYTPNRPNLKTLKPLEDE